MQYCSEERDRAKVGPVLVKPACLLLDHRLCRNLSRIRRIWPKERLLCGAVSKPSVVQSGLRENCTARTLTICRTSGWKAFHGGRAIIQSTASSTDGHVLRRRALDAFTILYMSLTAPSEFWSMYGVSTMMSRFRGKFVVAGSMACALRAALSDRHREGVPCSTYRDPPAPECPMPIRFERSSAVRKSAERNSRMAVA